MIILTSYDVFKNRFERLKVFLVFQVGEQDLIILSAFTEKNYSRKKKNAKTLSTFFKLNIHEATSFVFPFSQLDST